MPDIDNIFTFAAQQQTEAYNRIAAYKEKQAAHELLTAQIAHANAELLQKQALQYLRPCIMLKPVVTRDGDEWAARHGEVEGRGPTPDLAYQAFDAAWMGKTD